jgi:hypothetical protein
LLLEVATEPSLEEFVGTVNLDHGLDQSLNKLKAIWAQLHVPSECDILSSSLVGMREKKVRKLMESQITVRILVKTTEDLIDLRVQQVRVSAWGEQLSCNILEFRE